jgi:hypothetical protein
MARTINLHLDDSNTEILNFVRDKIVKYKVYLSSLHEDWEGNQLIISLWEEKLRTLEEVYLHLKYN